MAGHTYEVILRNTGEQTSKAVAGQQTPQRERQVNRTPLQQNVAAGIVAINKVKPFINQVIGYNVATVQLRTGSSERQQQIEFNYKIASGAFDLAETVAAGFAVGGGVGAAVGAVLGVASKSISFIQNDLTIRMNTSMENERIRQNYLKAGTNGSRSNYNE